MQEKLTNHGHRNTPRQVIGKVLPGQKMLNDGRLMVEITEATWYRPLNQYGFRTPKRPSGQGVREGEP